MATVPTGLQTCMRIVLQIQISGGGGTPWMQPKSNVTFKLALSQLLRFFCCYIFHITIFILVATVPTGLQTCANMLQIQISGGGGTPWMQPKINDDFSISLFLTSSSVWLLTLGLTIFHNSGHCAHRIANLFESAANTDFRGWGDIIGCNPKVM